MPDNFVPIEIIYDLYVRACHNAENLPSFCLGTAKSQLRPNFCRKVSDTSKYLINCFLSLRNNELKKFCFKGPCVMYNNTKSN